MGCGRAGESAGFMSALRLHSCGGSARMYVLVLARASSELHDVGDAASYNRITAVIGASRVGTLSLRDTLVARPLCVSDLRYGPIRVGLAVDRHEKTTLQHI